MSCGKPLKQEILKAIKKLKLGKQKDPIIYHQRHLKQILTQLQACFMNSLERFGKKRKCQLNGSKATSSNSARKVILENVRITLLRVVEKILNRVMLKRLPTAVNAMLGF